MATTSSTASPQAQAHQTVREAFERFEKIIKQDDHRNFKNTTLQDVRSAAVQIEHDLATRRSLRNMRRLDSLLKGLEDYSNTAGGFCNGTQYLLWAPIKFMLQITADRMDAFEKLIEAYGKIADSLPRFDRLSSALKNDQNFQAVLALVYADILEFHRRAYAMISKRGSLWNVLFVCGWRNFESLFKSILARLAYHSELVDKEAAAADISAAFERRKQELEKWEEQERESRRVKLHAVLSWLGAAGTVQEDELEKLSWNCVAGSCDWLIQHAQTRGFLSDAANPLMWLYGKPGAGKSVICSGLVQFMESQKINVLYYFCSYMESTPESPVRLLRSLVAQAIQRNPDFAVFVHDEYMSSHPSASRQALLQILPQVLTSIGSCRLVIDGLDEWQPKDQKIVLDDVKKVLSTDASSYVCKALISSREGLAISRIMRAKAKRASISLNDEMQSVERSIGAFIEWRLADLKVGLAELDPDGAVLSRVRQVLVEKSNGMFLWVRLVLDSLEAVYTREDVEEVVSDLPSGLTELYERILKQICDSGEPRNRDKTSRILKWICAAQRPLNETELRHGLALTPEKQALDESSIPIAGVLELCKPLIEVRRDSSVAFVHFSVQEFLLKVDGPKVPLAEAHHDVSFACTTILKSGLDLLDPRATENDRLVMVGGGLHRLLPYALEFWAEHLLLFASDLESLGPDHGLAQHLSELRSRHDRLRSRVGDNDTTESSGRHDSDDQLEPRLSRISGLHAYPLVRDLLRDRLSSTRESCRDGQDVELHTLKHDRTLFSRLAPAYEKTVHSVLSSDSVPGLAQEKLDDFKRYYFPIAYRCRYAPCPSSSLGFASEQLRVQHEAVHRQRIYCMIPGCQFGRVGFKTKNGLDNHMQTSHEEPKLAIPFRIRRLPYSNQEQTTEHQPTVPVMARKETVPATTTQEAAVSDTIENAEFEAKLAEVGSAIAKLDIKAVPARFKKEGSDWFAFYHPRAPVKQTIDLLCRISFKNELLHINFSPNGLYIAIGGLNLVRIFDVRTGGLRASLDHAKKPKRDLGIHLCFTTDGEYLVTSLNRRIRVWCVEGWKLKHELSDHNKEIYGFDVCSDSRTIAFCSSDRTFWIRNLETGSTVNTIESSEPVHRVAFSPDGLCVAGAGHKNVKVWSLSNSKILATTEDHTDIITYVAFSPDGKKMISAEASSAVRLWDMSAIPITRNNNSTAHYHLPCLQIFQGHQGRVFCANMTPDGAYILTGSEDKSVMVWNPVSDIPIAMIKGHSNFVRDVRASNGPLGLLVATADWDGLVRIWRYGISPRDGRNIAREEGLEERGTEND